MQQTRGLCLTHNHHLKAIFKGAATTVITQHPDEPLNAAYQRWLAAGTKPNLAKVSLARKIAAIALVMWKTEEEYDSSKPRPLPGSCGFSALPFLRRRWRSATRAGRGCSCSSRSRP